MIDRSSAPLRLAQLRRYGLAIFSVIGALGASLLLQRFHFRDAGVPLLLIAVAISSWYGGPKPAILATVLSMSSFYWYFVEPVRTPYIYVSEIPYFIIFAAFAVLISWFATIRKRAETALREKADLLDLTHDTVFVTNMEGVIKYWNRGAEERYGWTAEQAVGQDVHDLLKTVFPGPIEQIKGEVTRTGRWEGEIVHTKKDGAQVVVASRWSLERSARGAPLAILETNNDITERKRADEALLCFNRELRALSNCNQALLRATDEKSLLQEICRIVCEEGGYRPVWVSFIEHDEAKTVRPVAWAGTDEAYLDNAKISWSEDTERRRGPTGTAIRTGSTCCIQDIANDPRVAPWREILLAGGFRSAIALPLKDEHASVFGCLTMHSDRSDAFTPDETRLLEELAGDLAFGIVTLRSRAARQRAEQEVTLLSFALDKVREAAFLIDDSGHFRYVNESACRALGYARVELLALGVADIDPEFPAESWADHWRELKARRSLNFESHHRTRDGRVFPVEISGNYFEYGGGAYALTLVRDITERKRAEEALRRLNRELRAISDCNQTLLHATEEQRLLEEICRIVCEEAGYSVAWVGYAERDEAKSVRPVAWTGVEEKFLANLGITWADTERGRGPGATAIRTGKTCCVNDYATDPDVALWKDNASQHAFRSAIGLPLKDENANPFGSLIIYSAQTNAFTPEEIRLLEELAADLAFGIVTLRSRTARERAEQDLRQSEAYRVEAERLTRTGSWAVDVARDRYVYCSEEDLRIWGYDPQGPLPTREAVFRQVVPEDRNRVEESFQKTLREKIDTSCEYRIVLPDGTRKHVHVIRHPVLNSAGEVVKLVGTSMDITERKQAEDALRESETRFRAFVDHAADALFIYDFEQGTIVDVNRQACESVGYTRQELIGTAALAIHPDSDRAHLRSVTEGAAPGETVTDRHWHKRKDGTRFPVEVHTSQYWHGGRRFVLKIARDISDRLRAEEELRASESRFRTFVDHATDAFFVHDEHDQRRVIDVNRQACESLGYTREELIGMEPREFDPHADAALFQWIRERLDAGEVCTFETRHRRKDGTVFPVEVRVRSLLHGGRRLNLALARDITERKRAEEALRRSEAYLAEGQRLTHAGSWAWSPASLQSLYWSEEMLRIYGFNPQEGAPSAEAFWQRIHPQDLEGVRELLLKAASGNMEYEHDHRILLPDGTVKHIHAIGHPVLDENGKVIEYVGTAIDVTDQKRLEEERERLRQLEADLAHINRVSMLGELTASIAHAVNQPLSGVVSNGSACLRWLAGDAPNVEEARETARRIVRDGKRAGEIIARIRALTKRALTPREKLNLNETIREVLPLVGDEAKRNGVIIQTQLADELLPVSGDRVQLQQVILNLVMNGIEAMRSTGERARELLITTRNVDPEQIQVTVKDSGTGIDPNTLEKIFDPFYTTKPGGMGMGLSISRSILLAHGGQLWAAAKYGPGTTFHFSLPKFQEQLHGQVAGA